MAINFQFEKDLKYEIQMLLKKKNVESNLFH